MNQASTPIAVKVREAARMVGLSERRLVSLIQSGALASSKVGRSRLIEVEALHRLLNTTREEVAAKQG